MSAAQEITRHYGGDWHGSYGTFPAPGHSKQDRGVSVKDGANGDVVFNSFNGADWREIKDECRRNGLLPERQRANDNCNGPRETGHYEYVDADGAVLYRTVRIEQVGKRKQFRAQRPDGRGGWINGMSEVQRVLYRWPEIKAAIGKSVLTDMPFPTVYLVEGERKADKLASWGLTATAVAFGCKGWRKDYAEALEGCTVIILPDNDDEGRGFADRAGKDIEAAGGTVRIINLPGLPPKGDIIDWSGTAVDLQALVDNAINTPAKLLPLLDPAAWHGQETPSREWAWNDYIPHRQATYLTGPGSAGKSLLTQQLCTAIAMGLPFMGVETRRAVAIYVTCEDDADELHRRQKAICDAMGVPLSALSGKLHLVSLAGVAANELVTFTPEGKMIVGDAYRVLLDTAKTTGAGFLALDNVAHLFAGNENIRNQVAAFVSLLNGLALEIDGSVLFLGHPNKAGQDFSGSTAWENQVRSRLFMEVPKDDLGNAPDPDARVLLRGKANYARNGERLTFRWHKWAFILEDELPQDQRAEIAETILANAENEAFLACLRARMAQGDGREVGPSSGPNYAPSQFEGMPQAKGFGRAKLKRAMDRLYQTGKIKSETVMDRKAKREKTIIVEADEASHNSHNAPHNGSTTQVHNTAQRPHNMGSAHTYIINNMGAAQGSAAPSREEEEGPDLSRVVFAADDGLDTDGNIIGWDDDGRAH
ncbi:RecA-family ATPase [Sphingobium wenxiniae]|uniref:RecA-family ATPase n=1 Tax=Sphingobium wenxiniae (strain DSM 21828 / CGMCC 1.7748 / JZ-1) TaxID=595605 RepID=A0A562K238_SPHWJ|nr:AAA family ATPase [Sphingobium wenxiniae]MBB6193361.1 RecA-family ATPase [Sphingobium wenxiniae]TWH89492.1 RecA-family ATPase [Sphingobium wenxiniae]